MAPTQHLRLHAALLLVICVARAGAADASPPPPPAENSTAATITPTLLASLARSLPAGQELPKELLAAAASATAGNLQPANTSTLLLAAGANCNLLGKHQRLGARNISRSAASAAVRKCKQDSKKAQQVIAAAKTAGDGGDGAVTAAAYNWWAQWSVVTWDRCDQKPEDISCYSPWMCGWASVPANSVTRGNQCQCMNACLLGLYYGDWGYRCWLSYNDQTGSYSVWVWNAYDGWHGSIFCNAVMPPAPSKGLKTGGIVARPAEYRPYLTSCSWLNRPYNADTISTVSPVKCRDPANPADSEWYLFQYNSGQANWASVGLTWEVYNTAKVDPNCWGADCFVRGCARESCCVALCADTVAKGGQCLWQYFDVGGGVMKRWYDIRPVNQPSTACDPRGTGRGSGSSRGGGRGRHLLGQQPSLATTSNSVGPLEPAQRAHRRSLKQDVVAVPDRYLCDSRSDPSCYNFSYEYSIEADGVLRIVNIDCPSCPQDNALAVQLVAQML